MVPKFLIALCILAIFDLTLADIQYFFFVDRKGQHRYCNLTECVEHPQLPEDTVSYINALTKFHYYNDNKVQVAECEGKTKRLCYAPKDNEGKVQLNFISENV